jgi:hypothetical protein
LLEAEGLGKVSDVAVGKMLRRVESRFLATMQERVGEEKARQTARLEWLYGEACEGWRLSQQPKKKATGRQGKGKKAGSSGTQVKTCKQAGDPAFLGRAMQALKEIRDIWGGNAASVTEVGVTLSPEQVQRLEAILAAAQARCDGAAEGGSAGEGQWDEPSAHDPRLKTEPARGQAHARDGAV